MKQPSKQELEVSLGAFPEGRNHGDLIRFMDRHENALKYALQLAIDLQPRPISELGDIIQSKYKIIPAGNGTHFHDLSALPKPEGE